MYNNFQKFLQKEIQGIKDAGLYKNERVIITPQSAAIKTAEAGDVLNFCANNYLGLADSPVLINAAKKALDKYVENFENGKYSLCNVSEPFSEVCNSNSSL